MLFKKDINMKHFVTDMPQDPLIEVAQRYKQTHAEPSTIFDRILRLNNKNPDALLQIKLLNEAAILINNQFNGNQSNTEEKYMAELGILLILRDLLFVPNHENKVYFYLIKKLELDNKINGLLKKIANDVVFNLIDDKFLQISKNAVNAGQSILMSTQLKEAIPDNYLQYIINVIQTENEYINCELSGF